MRKKLPEASRDAYEYAIDQWIIGLNSERNRAILREWLFIGITHEKLAEKYDMSTEGIKGIIKRCMDIVTRHLPG